MIRTVPSAHFVSAEHFEKSEEVIGKTSLRGAAYSLVEDDSLPGELRLFELRHNLSAVILAESMTALEP